MDINLTIILIVMCIAILWLFVPFFGGSKTYDVRPLDPKDILLVQNYHKKSSYKSRVVLVIEEAQDDATHLVPLIRNILAQEIKADSIILISQNDENLKRVHLIRDTCVFNKIGGLTFLFKESGDHTIIIFIYPHGFDAFSDSQLLVKVLDSNREINGLTKIETNIVTTNINAVYHI